VRRLRLPRLRIPQFLKRTPASAAADRKRQVDDLLRKALFALLADDPETAEAALADSVRIDSQSLDAYVALCRFYRGRGEIGRAIRLHQNLLLRSDIDVGERSTVLFELARDFQLGGFLRRAVASYEEVIVYEPRNRLALSALVELSAKLRDFPRAISLEQRLMKLEKRGNAEGEARLLATMAEFEREEGRSKEARKAAKRALRRDPRCAPAQVVLGQLEADRGRDKAALEAWKKVPELDRTLAIEIYPRIESAFAATQQARDYEGYLRRLVDERPGEKGAALALARYLATRGDSEQAVLEMKRLLDRDPDNLQVRIVLGQCLLAAKRDEEIVAEFGRLLELLERSPRLLEGEGPE
jgi:lipopolysaccharide biosynthesis regulator YciM